MVYMTVSFLPRTKSTQKDAAENCKCHWSNRILKTQRQDLGSLLRKRNLLTERNQQKSKQPVLIICPPLAEVFKRQVKADKCKTVPSFIAKKYTPKQVTSAQKKHWAIGIILEFKSARTKIMARLEKNSKTFSYSLKKTRLLVSVFDHSHFYLKKQ